MWPGGFFPTNPDLADILGRTDLNFEKLHLFDFLDPTFLNFQVPRSPNFWISGTLAPTTKANDQTNAAFGDVSSPSENCPDPEGSEVCFPTNVSQDPTNI